MDPLIISNQAESTLGVAVPVIIRAMAGPLRIVVENCKHCKVEFGEFIQTNLSLQIEISRCRNLFISDFPSRTTMIVRRSVDIQFENTDHIIGIWADRSKQLCDMMHVGPQNLDHSCSRSVDHGHGCNLWYYYNRSQIVKMCDSFSDRLHNIDLKININYHTYQYLTGRINNLYTAIRYDSMVQGPMGQSDYLLIAILLEELRKYF